VPLTIGAFAMNQGGSGSANSGRPSILRKRNSENGQSEAALGRNSDNNAEKSYSRNFTSEHADATIGKGEEQSRYVRFNDRASVTEFDIWQDKANDVWRSCNARLHRKCTNTHDLRYRHSREIQAVNRHPNKEARRAVQYALEWRADIDKYATQGSRRDRNERRGMTTQFVPMQLRFTKTRDTVAAAAEMSEMRRWMADTGCCFDLISKEDLSREELSRSVKTQVPCRLKTANGNASANKTISFNHRSLEGEITAYIMRSTPTVLSVGKRCMHEGYSFIWLAGKAPFFITPSRNQITLEVINDIPYLPAEESFRTPAVACPAASVVAAPVRQRRKPAAGFVDESESSSSSEEEDKSQPKVRRDLKREADSLEHLMTHIPMNPHCAACQRAKKQHRRYCKHKGKKGHRAKKFGDHCTGDLFVCTDREDKGIGGGDPRTCHVRFGHRQTCLLRQH
jgi:hypothetical protein